MSENIDRNAHRGKRDIAARVEQLRRSLPVKRTLDGYDISGLRAQIASPPQPRDPAKPNYFNPTESSDAILPFVDASSPSAPASPSSAPAAPANPAAPPPSNPSHPFDQSTPKGGSPPKIAKTLIDKVDQNMSVPPVNDLPHYKSQSQSSSQHPVASRQPSNNPPPEIGISQPAAKGGQRRRPSMQFTARTLIDHNIIQQTRSQFNEREKIRIEQEISVRSLEPQKVIEPIEAKKKVSSCPYSWPEKSEKERFRHCSSCQAPIYNFEGLELAQAEALIFKRENRKKFTLFKREDGKFMTSDCPVATRRRHQLIGLVAVCICLVAAIGYIIMTLPPPPPPAVEVKTDKPEDSEKSEDESEEEDTDSEEKTDETKTDETQIDQSSGAPTTDSGGTSQNEAGKPATTTTTTTTDQQDADANE